MREKLLNLRRLGKIFLAVLLITVLTTAINVAVYDSCLKPSPEERRAEVLQILKDGGLQELLSDDQYDDNFLLVELKGTRVEDLMDFVRPIEISIVDQNKNVLASITEIGILMDRYVLTSPIAFSVLTNSILASQELQEALSQGTVGISVKLCADSTREDDWRKETIEIENISVGESVAVLERGEGLIFPAPAELPFRLGRIEDLNLGEREDVFYGVGCFVLGEGSRTLHLYQGEIELALPEVGVILVSSSVTSSDFGGPIFAIRDGEFELIGLAQYGEGGKASVIDMQTIFNEMEENGFKINIKFKE